MQFLRATGIAAVVLLFGTMTIVSAYAQSEKESKPEKQESKPQQPKAQPQRPPADAQPRQKPQASQPQAHQAKPAAPKQQAHETKPPAQPKQQAHEAKPPAQPKQQAQQAHQAKPSPQGHPTTQQATAWQQQKGWLKQGGGWQGHSTWAQSGDRNWNTDHRTWAQRGGYGGYYIPQNTYNLSFGSQHWFRIGGLPTMYMGYPRFSYGGFWFMLVDPWPGTWAENWYAVDDVYVDYDNGYYLCNRAYPDIRLAITVSL